MPMQKYSRYLPSYLDGDNIHRHAEILEGLDNLVYSQMKEIELWADLDRPILIERVATSNVVVYNVHIKCTTFIRSISITGDYTLREEYTMDDGLEETVITFAMPNNSLVDMAEFIVEVVDYEDITYQKGYPENDTLMGDVYDHDTALDNLGLILNLPRKSYISYPLSDADKSYPPYYGKEVEDNVVQPCSEDDYYYVQRLKLLKEHMHDTNMGAVLLELIYGYKGITVIDSTVLDNEQLVDHITEQYPEFEEYIQPGVYVFLIPEENPSNYESITMSDKQDFVDKYLPVTRYSVLANTIHTTMFIFDVSNRPIVIPGNWPRGIYRSDYAFDVLTDDEDHVTAPAQLTYQLDSNTPVLVDYDVEDLTLYSDATLLSPGLHHVRVSYPASLGYEACTAEYMFKFLLDTYKKVEASSAYSYYYPNNTNNTDNTIRAINTGMRYTQADTNHPGTDEYDYFPALTMPTVSRDTMVVIEYDVTGVSGSYSFGVDALGQRFTRPNVPTRLMQSQLTGSHRVSVELPSGRIFVDGRLAGLNKPLNTSYIYTMLFLKLHTKGGVVDLGEHRVSQYLPYWRNGDGLYRSDLFLDWQEYTVRAVVEAAIDVTDLDLFVGVDDTGLHYTIPSLTTGRHNVALQVVNNKGYLYIDEVEVGVLYDFDTCKQYSYTAPFSGLDSASLVHEDTVLLFNSVCDLQLEENEDITIKTVGIAPTTLLDEIEQHTPVHDVVLGVESCVTEVMPRMVDGFLLPVVVSVNDENGYPIEGLPCNIIIGEDSYPVNRNNPTTLIPLKDEYVFNGEIQYTVESPPGRYYRAGTASGTVVVGVDMPVLWLDYTELLGGRECTLHVQAYNADGTPVTSATHTLGKVAFRYGGITIKENGVAVQIQLDSNGSAEYTFTVPEQDIGRKRTIYARAIINKTQWRSNTWELIVQDPTIPLVDPLCDEEFLTLDSWGTYPSNSSGSSQSGTLTQATSSDLTLDTNNKTITDKNTKYYVYKYTLQDLLGYYNDEFSITAYKTGGDGRYQLGFVDTTNGDKLGYSDGYIVSNATGTNQFVGEVAYQKYNQFTFKRVGTDLHVYWRSGGTTYVVKTLSISTVDLSKYYLYWRSTVRNGLTLTTNTGLIQNYSRSP